jgi:hypothetical protein
MQACDHAIDAQTLARARSRPPNPNLDFSPTTIVDGAQIRYDTQYTTRGDQALGTLTS